MMDELAKSMAAARAKALEEASDVEAQNKELLASARVIRVKVTDLRDGAQRLANALSEMGYDMNGEPN
jgi:uncharacterized coiled-coil DUF342 family protein